MDAIEIRRKRLLFRSWHRGCKETDVILGPYAEQALSRLNQDQLDVYESFLEEFDSNIWDWLVEKNSDYDPKYHTLIEELKHFAQSRHIA